MPTSSRFAVAVHVLALMAWADDEPLKSEYIAGSVNTNAVVIRRILCALARAGLVTSQTGAAGGSRLARPAHQVTLRDVYRAVEGQDIFSLPRRPPNDECPIGMNIENILVEVQGEVDDAVDQVLGHITVERILQSFKACGGRKRKARRHYAR